MAELEAYALLALRERALGLHPIDQALAMAAVAAPDAAVEALPLADRDRVLLALRAGLQGDRLDCLAECPACGDALEFALSATETAAGLASPPPERLSDNGWEVELRPLNSRDLAAAAGAPGAEAAEAILAARAIAITQRPLELAPDSPLPDALGTTAAQRVAEREAMALVEVALNCAGCGAEWTEAVDIGAHVWAEVDSAAAALIVEVAALAGHYGWAEADILAMPAIRRRTYLALTTP